MRPKRSGHASFCVPTGKTRFRPFDQATVRLRKSAAVVLHRHIDARVARLRHDLGDEYALATRRVATDGVSLLADMSRSSDHAEWARAVDGQLAIREVK